MQNVLPDVKKVPTKKLKRHLEKMQKLSKVQAGFIQLVLSKIDRRSKPI